MITPHTQHILGAILQFNCNGNLHYMQELSSLLHSKNILIACISNGSNNRNRNRNRA